MQRQLLIIEDDFNIANIMRFMFSREGIEADIASNGKEALIQLAKHDYKAITLDLQMPIMSGWEFLHLFDKSKHNKIIVFSGYSDMRLDDYKLYHVCDKPSDGQQLLEKVKELCQPQVNV